MKHLKHIQVFEAFESKILSKTLGYIKEPNDREKFFDQIKRLCNSIDYPYSEMSDDFFEYLPFKKAINKAAMTGDEPCEATSKSEFPEYAVDGAKCEGGKLKRKWGARTREVVCPVCNGTGVKPKKSEVKLVKFWFTSEGKYVTTTIVDGVIRSGKSGSKISTRLSDYIVSSNVSDINTLTGGEIVSVNIRGDAANAAPDGKAQVIAYIVKEYGRYFAIQNKVSGSTPSASSWRSYGKYSWALGSGEYSDMKLLTKKPKSKEEEEVDPYTWNVGVNFSYGQVSVNSSIDVQNVIKDAHFAIVFDYGKLKKSEFKNREETKQKREEAKEGSKLDPNQSDVEIRKRNIERYVNLLSQKLDISTDIGNCNRLVVRALGHKAALYIVYGTNIYSYLTNLIDSYMKFMKADDNNTKKSYAEDISEKTNDMFKSGMKRADRTNDIVKDVRSKLKANNADEKYIQLLDLTQKLSDAIYDNIKNYQIDSIEDLEVVAQKISSIRNILKSDRYGLSRYFNYYISYVVDNRPERAYDYLSDPYYVNIDAALENLPRIITIISKL